MVLSNQRGAERLRKNPYAFPFHVLVSDAPRVNGSGAACRPRLYSEGFDLIQINSGDGRPTLQHP